MRNPAYADASIEVRKLNTFTDQHNAQKTNTGHSCRKSEGIQSRDVSFLQELEHK